MPEHTHDKNNRLQELEHELAESRKREKYYQEIAALAGRKRLLETRELSELVIKYRADQELLSANSERLEELVKARTNELEATNEQLRRIILEQKQTQEQLERVVNLDRIILDISSEFINQPAQKIDSGIHHALERIGRSANAVRVSLFIVSQHSETILNTHDWKKKKTQKLEEFHDHYFRSYLEELRLNKNVIVETVKDLAALTAEPVDHIAADQFQSLLAVPMLRGGSIYGALFLYGPPETEMTWTPELIRFVKIISDVLVNALDRKVTEVSMRESEERYRDLVEKAGLAIVMDAEDGSFHYFNKRFADLFGYSEKEIAERNMADLIHPDDMERVMALHRKRFHNEKVPTRYDFRGITKNGNTLYLEVDVVALKMKNQMIATRSYIWDVSHQVLVQRTIQESEERYRNLVENFSEIVMIMSYQGHLHYVNPAFTRQTGYDISEFDQAKKILTQVPRQYDRLRKWGADFVKSGKDVSKPIECQFTNSTGDTLYYSVIMARISYKQKPALQFVAHNITDQKQAAAALKRTADFERTVSEIMSQFVGSKITDASLQTALQAVAMWSHAGRATIYRVIESGHYLSSMYEWCDAGVEPLYVHRQNIPIGHLAAWDNILARHGLIHVPDVSQLPPGMAAEHLVKNTKDIKSFLFLPFRVQNRTYGAISLEDTKMTNRWSRDDIKLLRLTSEIIGNAFERIEAEERLRRSEEQYRTLFESSNDEIYLHGINSQNRPSTFLNVNETACRRLGYEKHELLRKTVYDVDAESEHDKIVGTSKAILRQGYHIFETLHKTKDGRCYPVEVSAHMIEVGGRAMVMSIARDISERKRIEEELQKSQRLESIGILAGGIAHDFNNLLSIILGNAQLAKMMGEQQKDISKFLQNIEEGAAQASTLTRQLLTFSKGGAPIREVYPLPELIRNAVQLALSGLDEHAVFDFDADLYHAKVDKGQINQVIHNLILNSDQAMPNGGVIEVSAKNVHSDEVKSLRRVQPGDYVRIRIKDYGIGITEENQQKIFNPYFTTKEKGNGLGLTVAYSIIKKHDGLLTLNSTPGEGTTVDIYLPAVLEQRSKKPSHDATSETLGGFAIVMDDETMILDVAEGMLLQLGFQVERALNGEELLQKYQHALEAGQKPDVVIMDLTIPAGMGGTEAIKELRQLDPEVKALVSSGYSNDKIMSNYKHYGFAGVVAKPYTLDDLQRVITKVLKT